MDTKDFVKPCDAWTSQLFFSRIAVPCTRFCASAGIHPNGVTVLGMLLAAANIALLLLLPSFVLTPLLSVILFCLYWLMDHIDGQLARMTGKTSKVGALLDTIGDKGGKAGTLAAFAAGPLRVQNALIPALVLIVIHYTAHWYVNYHLGKLMSQDHFYDGNKKHMGFFTSFEETLLMLAVAPLFYSAPAILALWTLAVLLFLADSFVFPGGSNSRTD